MELKENIAGQSADSGGKRSDRYIFNVSFAAYFTIILLLALLRIVVNFGAFDWAGEDGIDLIFSFIAQIMILAGGSLLVIKCFFRKGFKGTLDYLQVKKPKPYIFLAVAIAFFGYFVNIVINVISFAIYSFLGWHAGASESSETYPLWMFFVSILFTAVLPGICEEIAHRGLVLRAMKAGGASDTKTILVTGLFFGLFHMYLGQTAFAFVMGCTMTFLTVKSKSIVPAVIMHFINNFMAVCFDFFGLMNPIINSAASGEIGALMLFMLFCAFSVVVFILLLILFLKRARKAGDCPPKAVPVFQAPHMAYGLGIPFAPQPYPQQQYMRPQSQAALPNRPVRPANQGGEAYGFAFGPQQQPPQQPYNPYAQFGPYAQQQPYNPYAQPGPYAQQQPYNPYAQPGPYAQQQPYDPYAQLNPHAAGFNVPLYASAYYPPAQTAPRPPVTPSGFKPSVKDKIFYYGTLLFAGMITIISFISGL